MTKTNKQVFLWRTQDGKKEDKIRKCADRVVWLEVVGECVCVCTRLLSKWVDCCCVSSSYVAVYRSNEVCRTLIPIQFQKEKNSVCVVSPGTIFVSGGEVIIRTQSSKLFSPPKILNREIARNSIVIPRHRVHSVTGFIKGHWVWTPPRWCFLCPVTNTKSP